MALPRIQWLTSGGYWRPAYDPINVIAEPPVSGLLATTLVLTMGATSIHSGSTVSASAVLKRIGTGIASKSVLLEKKDPTGGTWTLLDTKTTNGSGVATFTAQAPTVTTSYRARFITDATYVGSTAATKSVTVQTLQTFTKRYSATWSNTYNNGTNAQVGPLIEIQQGDNATDTTMTKRKSLIGFPASVIATDLTNMVAAVYIKFGILTTASIDAHGPAKYLLGWHDYVSKPATYDPLRVQPSIITDFSFTMGSFHSEALISSAGVQSDMEDFRDAIIRGIAVGPPPSTDPTSYYLVGYGVDPPITSQPIPFIEFQFTKWA